MPARRAISRRVAWSKPRSRKSERAASRMRARLLRPRSRRPSSARSGTDRVVAPASTLDAAARQLTRAQQQQLRLLEARLDAGERDGGVDAVLDALVVGPADRHAAAPVLARLDLADHAEDRAVA